MTTTDWIQAISTAILVIVTAIYAWRTHVISTATEKQEEEVRKQRYSESLPLLVPNIPPILRSEKLPYESISSGNGVRVKWCNVGKGVAINSRFSFWTAPTSPNRAWFFPSGESVTVEVGGKREIDYSNMLNDAQLRDIPKEYHPHLLAEYRDIYEREISTIQEFRIEEHNNYKIVLLGELYFKINGRRLGGEVT